MSLITKIINSLSYRWIEMRYAKKKFKHNIAIAAIFKNEASNLFEWLTFHSGVGVTHFYLYNNNSTDNYFEILSPWIENGQVTLIDWPKGHQRGAYTHCIRQVRSQCRWIAFIDLDEFLYSPSDPSLCDALKDYEGSTAVFVYWVLFGSSKHDKPPKGYVLENYTHCLFGEEAEQDQFDHHFDGKIENYVTGWAKDGKSIVDPRKVRIMNPHRPKILYTGKILDENMKYPLTRGKMASLSFRRLRINHYWAKSSQELTQKIQKGNIANPSKPQRNLSRWKEREKGLNKTENLDIQPLWANIKKEYNL